MLDAVSTCIGEREKSRDRYLRGELLFYAQRRQSGNASAHRVHIRGCSFGRPSVPDSSLQLRMTIKIAQNDREDRAERQ